MFAWPQTSWHEPQAVNHCSSSRAAFAQGTRRTNVPVTKVRVLVTKVRVPVTKVRVPVTKVPVPVTKVFVPVTKVRVPVTKVRVPVTKVRVPVTKARAPVTKARAPVTKARVPVTKARVPVTKVRVPVTKVGVPVTKVRVPVTKVRVPVTKVHVPLTKVRVPVTKVRVPVTKVRVPVTKVRVPVTKVRVPVTKVRVPVTKVRVPVNKMEGLVREMQDHETGVPVRSQKLFLTSIPSAFMVFTPLRVALMAEFDSETIWKLLEGGAGYDLIEWLMERLNIEESGNRQIVNSIRQDGSETMADLITSALGRPGTDPEDIWDRFIRAQQYPTIESADDGIFQGREVICRSEYKTWVDDGHTTHKLRHFLDKFG
uniref:Uncharacterized protein n=1 Tax=Timema douglasi TaxID=61478 RepID=A0A7R8VSA9_TIMDO|nr:unnamed protein product [Timema douglasi]